MTSAHDPALSDAAVTYMSYLKIDELLTLQEPLSSGPEHDELLFIIIHQSYELWFKSLLHELRQAKRTLEAGDTHLSLGLLGRVRTILKTLVGQVDILETMTPLQFNTFRDRLAAASGFQSRQFRQLETVLGGREPVQEGLWQSVIGYLATRDHVPSNASHGVNDMLVSVYRNDPEAALLLERLVDIDEGLQEWRYRHIKMVERTIGTKMGTGGSSGAQYLATTLFQPVFPELWQVRAEF
ncbi:MAG: tryptophan 2,3-dioxygenase family protein [Ilumatobacteraceae bacterium]